MNVKLPPSNDEKFTLLAKETRQSEEATKLSEILA